MSEEQWSQIVAALIQRIGTGVVRLDSEELRTAPVDRLVVHEDGEGGTYVRTTTIVDSPVED